jgi:hypothetical protein
MENNSGVLLKEAIEALRDAVSYVEEMGYESGGHGAEYLSKANSLISDLRKSPIEIKDGDLYRSVLDLNDLLGRESSFLSSISSVKILQEMQEFIARKIAFLSFKNECQSAIHDLNSIMECYNDIAGDEFKLISIDLPKDDE